MRYSMAVALVLVACVCQAEDPLESLNTVEDTLITMKQTLQARATVREHPSAGAERNAPAVVKAPVGSSVEPSGNLSRSAGSVEKGQALVPAVN